MITETDTSLNQTFTSFSLTLNGNNIMTRTVNPFHYFEAQDYSKPQGNRVIRSSIDNKLFDVVEVNVKGKTLNTLHYNLCFDEASSITEELNQALETIEQQEISGNI